MPPVTEEELRDFVRVAVADDGSDGQTAPLVVDEFVVGTEGRIDLALVGDALIGYELKSDLDTLRRLPQQMSSYSKVFDFCTLVVTDRHLGAARRALDSRWGLAVVRREAGKLTYKQIRKARPLRRTDAVALAGLLWRDEALHALDLLGAAAGLRSKPRDVLWERLAQVASQDELRAIVVRALTARQGWRDVQAPREYDETFQYAGASSRFLARRFRPQYR
ncbi:sce7726 family protein [Curtobacterium sp. MCSS17_008]|uniref:sce7726 family protein n=1 Tax=Curtobacterium sp. MCSS17_008 TaxID=2175647 RepID=UPI0015E8C1ED